MADRLLPLKMPKAHGGRQVLQDTVLKIERQHEESGSSPFVCEHAKSDFECDSRVVALHAQRHRQRREQVVQAGRAAGAQCRGSDVDPKN